jgi:glycine cleavage system H protein
MIDDEIATVGVTQYAADALGDVVYIELPAVGAVLAAGQVCGEVESTKSVSDLNAPAAGEVIETNQQVVDDPGSLNADPFGGGWLFRMRLSGAPELMDAAAYQRLTDDGA